MIEAGAVALSDGQPMMNTGLLRRALDYARPFGVPVVMRPGDTQLEGAGVMHEGRVATQIGLRVSQLLLKKSGGPTDCFVWTYVVPVHLSAVTTAAIKQIVRQRMCSRHCSRSGTSLVLTEEAVSDSVYDTTRLLPPCEQSMIAPAGRFMLESLIVSPQIMSR